MNVYINACLISLVSSIASSILLTPSFKRLGNKYNFKDIPKLITLLVIFQMQEELKQIILLFLNFLPKMDPIPTVLTQNHVSIAEEFIGQTTGFNKNFVKKSVLIMGEDYINNQAKYIHGNIGKGTFHIS